MNPSTLYIIDGHAQIYRAYYAVMGLRSPSGEPTNATFGFVAMLLKLYQTRKPTHVVLAMDAGTSGRETMDANYKAQRKPMPEDMPSQIERILQIVDTLGMPILRTEGFEADDVIATVVRKIRLDPARHDCMLYMCTKDKDLDQLIDDKTRMFDIQLGEEIDAAKLFEKKGYTPTQARDVLALTGDTVDNIPGIPGVGPKTAAKWIAEYGDIDNLITNSAKLTGKIGQTFRDNVGVLAKSRQLVELMFDVPVEFTWDTATVHPENLTRLRPIFQELGFTRLIDTLEQTVGAVGGYNRPAAPSVPPKPVPRESKPKSPAKIEPSGGLFDNLPEQAAPAESVAAEVAEETPADPTPAAPATGLAPVVGEYVLVNTPAKLDEMLATLRQQLGESAHGFLAVDTETDALGSMASNLCGISLSAKEGTGYYVAVIGVGDEVLDAAVVCQKLAPMLSDAAIKKVGQNIKYDLNALRIFGLELGGVFADTMIISYLLDATRLSHGMDALAADFLGLKPIPISELIGKGQSQISFADVQLARAAHYSAEDADVTLRLANLLYPKLVADPQLLKLFAEVEMPLVLVLADMEFHGVKIDAALLAGMSKTLGDRLVDLRNRIKDAAGIDFNMDSPKQLADVLFKTLKLPIMRKNKTGPSTDITVLEALSDKHPVPALIVEYRQLTKLKNTYLDTLGQQVNPRTGRIHASFNQTVAETGRLSSSDPNLQNIPVKTEIGREIRKAFVAEGADSVLLTADYSQIELRMLAHYCGEEALLEAFKNNRDVHRVVAAEIYHVPEDQVTTAMRSTAKTVNFGIIYGQTGFGLSQVLKIPQDEANQYITSYRRRFPKIEQFSHECVQQASVHGSVSTILGRRRAIPDIHSPIQARRQFGQRAALNSVIQGSAADLIKLAMVRIYHRLAAENGKRGVTSGSGMWARLIMQIHDELVFECKEADVKDVAAMVRQEMEHAMELRVPLKVDINWGKNWLEGK